ncbi:MAG: hypothetical protein IIC75_03085 [Bacteroidetes bacterium]|nr:hypothetical protein [Bacteroidota bacterium]
MRLITFNILFIFIIFQFYSCGDKSVTPFIEPLNPEELILIDASFSSSVYFLKNSTKPDLDITGKFIFSINSDSVVIKNISLQIENKFIDSLSLSKIILTSKKDSITISNRITDIFPFVEYPDAIFKIEYVLYSNSKKTVKELVFEPNLKAIWNISMEPNVNQITLPSQIKGIDKILWKKDNSGFYFAANNGGLSERLYFYLVSDKSIQDVSFRTDSYRILDISHDDKFLLVSDNNGKPSGLYIYDILLNKQKLLLPPQDSLLISTGAFSSDDNIIALSTIKLDSVIHQYQVWLLNRSDSTLIQIPQISNFNSTEIDSWLPNSNDKIAYRNRGTWFSIYSISQNYIQTIGFPSLIHPWKLLSDGTEIIGLHISDVLNSQITENHLVLLNINGNVIRQLTFYPEVLFEYTVSPNKNILAFTGYRENKWGLWIENI